MTVAVATPRVQYVGNGVTLAFDFPQKAFALTDIKVYRELISTAVETLVDPSEYTASGAAIATGGYSSVTITFLVAPTANHRITLVRDTTKTQDSDYVPNDGFPAEAHENAQDKVMMALQEMGYDLSRCLKVNRSANGDMTFPSLIAGFLFSNGSTLEFKALGDITAVPTYGASILYGLDVAKAAAPTLGSIYLATDTKKFYRCYVAGTWSVDEVVGLATANGFIYTEQVAAPVTAVDQLAFYTKNVAGQPELFYRKESNGAEIQVTSNGVINTAILPAASTGFSTGDYKFSALPYSSAPAGFLACQGAAVSRATYAALFALLAERYGAGDGVTTFNLPDFRDRFPIGGKQDDAGSAKTNLAGSLELTGGDTNQPPRTAAPGGGGNDADAGVVHNVSPNSHTHAFTPPFLACSVWIKT